LRPAVLYGSKGAVDIAHLIQSDDKEALDRIKIISQSSDKMMTLRPALRDAINKKDYDGAKPIVDEMNDHSLRMTVIGQGDKVDWTSIRVEEGILGGKRPVIDSVKLTKQEALMLKAGQLDPTKPVHLGVILKANYGDYANRCEGGDVLGC